MADSSRYTVASWGQHVGAANTSLLIAPLPLAIRMHRRLRTMIGKPLILGAIVFVALVVLAFLPRGLDGNRRLWLTRKPLAYRFHYWNPVSAVRSDPWASQEIEITVVRDKVVSARRMDTKAYHPNPDAFPTIDKIFEWVADAQRSPEKTDLTYDREYGFPNFVDVGEIEADQGYQYILTEFEIIDEQASITFEFECSDSGDLIRDKADVLCDVGPYTQNAK